MCFGVILATIPTILLALTAPQSHHSVAIHVKHLQPPLVVKHGDLLTLVVVITLPLISLPSLNTDLWHHSVIVWIWEGCQLLGKVYTSTNPRQSLKKKFWIHSSTFDFSYHSRGGLDNGGSERHDSKMMAFVSINFSFCDPNNINFLKKTRSSAPISSTCVAYL